MTIKKRVRADAAKVSRRCFLSSTGAAALGFAIVQGQPIGAPGQVTPSERVNVAGIGAGGMGGGDIATVAKLGCNIVALCDVDGARAAGTFKAFPKARRYKDFREMLDKEARHIDAVTVGTPDHVHAVAAMAAIRAGKHVYVQKPLTHTLLECRELTKAARAAGVMTSMGNQGHASEGSRLTNEWIQAGVIGEVREVHVWSDRRGDCGSKGSAGPAARRPCRPRLIGTCGSARFASGRIIRPTRPSAGAAGGTSALGRLATWAATSSTTRFGP